MYLSIPTWLVFLFLGIASFAPVVSLRPRWWALYYGALLVCWALVSVAASRRMARQERRARRKFVRTLRKSRDAEPAADASRRRLRVSPTSAASGTKTYNALRASDVDDSADATARSL